MTEEINNEVNGPVDESQPRETYKNKFDPMIEKINNDLDRRSNIAQQQDRTLEKKAMFLIAYERAHGIVATACEYAGIKSRKTYYNWYNLDPDFRKAIADVDRLKNGYVEDLLLQDALYREKPWAIKFYLDRKHPDYIRKYIRISPIQRWYKPKQAEEAYQEAREKMFKGFDEYKKTSSV